MRYYPSADAMSRALELPLLLRADPELRFLERHERVSGYAVDAPHSARLLHRVRAALGGEPFDSRTLLVFGPFGTLEQLPWAVGLASQLSDLAARSFLLSRALAEFHGGARSGETLPAAMNPLAEEQLSGPAIAVSTDLAGVRLIVRGTASGSRASDSTWTLVVAETLPEVLEGPYDGPGGAAGTILVAAFRDHGVYELECAARGLKSAGHRMLGLIAIGPDGEIAEDEPSERPSERPSGLPTSARPNAPSASFFREPIAPSPSATPESVKPPLPHPEALAGPLTPPPVLDTSTDSPPAPTTPPAAPASPSAIAAAIAKTEAARTEARAKKAERAASKSSAPVSATPHRVESPEPHPEAGVRSLPSSVFLQPTPRETRTPGAIEPPRAPERAAEPLVEPVAESATETPTPPAVPLAAVRPPVALLTSWEKAGRKRARLGRVGAVVGVLALVGVGAVIVLSRLGLLPVRALAPSAPDSSNTAATVGADADTANKDGFSRTRSEPETWIGAAFEGDTLSESESEGESQADAPASIPDSTPLPRSAREIPFERMVAVESVSVGAETVLSLPRRLPFSAPDSAARATRRLGESVGRDTFVVHLSSFRLEREALAEIALLREAGFEARTVRVELAERGPWYRIVTGRFATFSEAEAMAVRLCRMRGVPRTHVVGQNGRGEPIPIDSLGTPDPTRQGMDSR